MEIATQAADLMKVELNWDEDCKIHQLKTFNDLAVNYLIAST